VAIFRRFSGPPCCSFAPLAVVAVMAFAISLSAQTVPQLLPSTVKTIAGGGTSAVAKGGTCPVSGYIATDAYGDGCLATEVLLGTSASAPGPRAAIADAAGNVYFGDYVNGVVHRVDAITGVLSAVAGGAATSPAANATCGANTSTDAKGDGCLATLVHLSHPTDLVFSPAGDLYIADYGYGQVRKVSFGSQSVVAAIPVSGGSGYTTAPTVTFSAPATGTTATGTATITSGVVTGVTITNPGSGYTSAPTVTFSAAPSGGVTATGVAVDSGIITLAAGSAAGTFGYNISNATTTVTAAQSVLDGPYGLAFDNQGDLFIEDEFTAAVVVLNTNTTGSNTVNNTVIPAGTIWKIAGTLTTGGPYCTNGTTSSAGCTFNHVYTEGIQANSDWLRNAYGLALDSNGNVYITNEFYDTIQKVAPSGILTTYVGVQNSNGKTTTRGKAPSITIGSPFGVAADSYNNLYFTDAADGTIWRVDATTQNQFLIASGFGSSGTGFASTTLPGPGIFHVSVDPYADLFYADTEKNIVGEVASGTQFGVIGANQPTNNVVIHFGVGDIPATANPYTLTSGAGNFSLGTATCTTNTDSTTDCTLPITATPSVLGPFSATLKVASALGGVSNFTLNGIYAQSPNTRTSLSYVAGISCSGTTTYSTTTTVTLTAILTANGPAPPVGSADKITFYANNGTNTAIGTVPVSNLGTTSAPVYGATLTYTFATPGTYTLTAVYSGDSYFKTSTGTSTSTITSSTPSFTLAPTPYSQSTVTAGQTALYSFYVNQNVYSGTITFTVTGLPANSSYSVSPAAGFTATGCSVTNTVTLSIFTQQATKVTPAGFGASGRGPWQMLCVLAGLGLSLMIGLRRRRVPLRYGQIWMALALLISATGMVACGKSVGTILQPATPSGTYTITVTAVPSVGTAPPAITFPLIVN
jgi:hypothetical protein